MALYSPLRCDIYKLVDDEYVKVNMIIDVQLQLLSSTVSNSVIIYHDNHADDEFSTANLIHAELHPNVNAVLFSVRKVVSFVNYQSFRYYFYFGTEEAAANCYETFSKHVHKSLKTSEVA
uniref:Uncharacterized protein n=1 Tax=Panagrolaimus sp. JU765 TaxID=591449 RepID=A0AC34R6M8_9BILA